MGRLLEKAVIALVFVGTVFVSCVSCVSSLPKKQIEAVEAVVAVERQVPPPGKLWPSVALLHVEEKKPGYATLATGWAIDADHLITAGHFCEGIMDNIKLDRVHPGVLITGSDSFGGDIDMGKAVIIAYKNDKMDDICILFKKDHGLIPLPVLGDLSLVETEDQVTISGAPRGMFPIRIDGRIWVVNPDLLLLALQIAPGNSGSPVIWNGKVIGMVIAVLPVPGVNTGIAVRSDKLLEFYQTNKLGKKAK